MRTVRELHSTRAIKFKSNGRPGLVSGELVEDESAQCV